MQVVEGTCRLPRSKCCSSTTRPATAGLAVASISILKFIDPAVVFRAVLLPRDGIINTLLTEGGAGTRADAADGKTSQSRGVVDEVVFERHFIENPYEPLHRPIEKRGLQCAGVAAHGASRRQYRKRRIRLGPLGVARSPAPIRFDLLQRHNGCFRGRATRRRHTRSGVVARAIHVRAAIRKRLHDRLASSRGVRRIVCVSKVAAAQFPNVSSKVRVIHNGIDTEEFSRES